MTQASVLIVDDEPLVRQTLSEWMRKKNFHVFEAEGGRQAQILTAEGYALLQGIEYVYDECPHAEGSTSIYYKEVLNQMETERPGIKLSFYLSFLQARQSGFLEAGPRQAPDLRPCPNCGQPIRPGALVCVHCGAEQGSQESA